MQAQENPLPPRKQKQEARAKISGHSSAAAAQSAKEANLRKISLLLYASKVLQVKLRTKAAFKQVGQYHDANEERKEARLRKKLAGIVGAGRPSRFTCPALGQEVFGTRGTIPFPPQAHH
eukprot:COSAG01_NODE_30798_length_608_cov_1.201961_1_plen_119_part_10